MAITEDGKWQVEVHPVEYSFIDVPGRADRQCKACGTLETPPGYALCHTCSHELAETLATEHEALCGAAYDRHAVTTALANINAHLAKDTRMEGYIANEPCEICDNGIDDASEGVYVVRVHKTVHYLCDVCCDRFLAVKE